MLRQRNASPAWDSDTLPELSTPLIRALIVVALALSVAGFSRSVCKLRRPTIATVETRINPNHADEAALALLPGVGPALAGRIVAERERAGPFHSPDDLQRVPGIGPRIARRLGGSLRFGDAADASARALPTDP